MSQPRRTPFLRFAAWVGDLGSPFYAEERQRDVWNEASAFGLQFLIWTGFGLAAVMLWFGGRPVLPWAFAVLVLVGVASWLVIGYARALGVEVSVDGGVSGGRLVACLALLLSIALGAVRAAGSGFGGSGLVIGFVVGAAGAAGLVTGMAWRAKRRERAAVDGRDGDVPHPGL